MFVTDKIDTAVRVTRIELSADDWELFDDAGGERAEGAARVLNKKLTVCVNKGLSREETRAEMELQLKRYEDYGATDTEPRNVLSILLDKCYPPEWRC